MSVLPLPPALILAEPTEFKYLAEPQAPSHLSISLASPLRAAATRGMDRNAAVNGIAYSIGGMAARQLVLRDFDEGRQRAAMSHAEAARKDRVEHLVPRRFAADSPDKHPSTSALLRSKIIFAAAKLTSDMLRVYKPELYARESAQVSNPHAQLGCRLARCLTEANHGAGMNRHAPNHRISADAVWTTGRLALSRAGAWVSRHPDGENMPQTDGCVCAEHTRTRTHCACPARPSDMWRLLLTTVSCNLTGLT